MHRACIFCTCSLCKLPWVRVATRCSALAYGEVATRGLRLRQDVLDFLVWAGHDVAGAALVRSQPREALQLHRTLAEAGVTNMETLVVEAGQG